MIGKALRQGGSDGFWEIEADNAAREMRDNQLAADTVCNHTHTRAHTHRARPALPLLTRKPAILLTAGG